MGSPLSEVLDMSESVLHVYVDESGDNKLDTSARDTRHLFHVVAVVVDDEQRSAAEKQLDRVSRIHFGGGEIKSRNAGARRMRIMESVGDIDFAYYALIVNKDRVDRDSGYKWKKSFYKATRSKIYRKVAGSHHQTVSIYSDQIGSTEYMDSFPAYLREKVLTEDLFFTQPSHHFVASCSSRLVQLADFIAGTLAYCFDPDTDRTDADQLRHLLRAKEQGIEVWPPSAESAIVALDLPSELDKLIAENLLERAMQCLARLRASSGEEDAIRQYVLGRLLFLRLHTDDYIRSDVLIEELQRANYATHGHQWFTSKIIGDIRDAGVIIAGTGRGYRLAITEAEIGAYLEHNTNVVFPMLNRVCRAQESVRAATLNQLDVLDKAPVLRELVATFREEGLQRSAAARVTEEDESIDS